MFEPGDVVICTKETEWRDERNPFTVACVGRVLTVKAVKRYSEGRMPFGCRFEELPDVVGWFDGGRFALYNPTQAQVATSKFFD
jgi:hypothetical protein